MYNGVSAMDATTTYMDVIGNNIANINTDAFKQSDVNFADQLSDTIQAAAAPTSTTGGTNPIQTGTGVSVASMSIDGAQGTLTQTSLPTDLAISGNGYFQVATSNGGINYTRDGNFALDSNGSLVQADSGQPVLGWTANSNGQVDNTTPITSTSTLQLGVGSQTSAAATTEASYTGNLSADNQNGATYSSSMTVYDSQGSPHTVTLTFTQVLSGGTPPAPTNTYDWTASGDTGLAAPNGTTNQGTITFNASGDFVSSTGTISLDPSNSTPPISASPMTVTPNFSALTQFSGSSTVTPQSQNGYATGTLQSFSVNSSGIITGSFSNGQASVLGQIALADFSNPSGLTAIGNDSFSPSANSGTPITAAANANGMGTIEEGYLEQSNVDLGTQFSNMIIAQRSYQANSQIVSTVDQMLSDLLQTIQQG